MVTSKRRYSFLAPLVLVVALVGCGSDDLTDLSGAEEAVTDEDLASPQEADAGEESATPEVSETDEEPPTSALDEGAADAESADDEPTSVTVPEDEQELPPETVAIDESGNDTTSPGDDTVTDLDSEGSLGEVDALAFVLPAMGLESDEAVECVRSAGESAGVDFDANQDLILVAALQCDFDSVRDSLLSEPGLTDATASMSEEQVVCTFESALMWFASFELADLPELGQDPPAELVEEIAGTCDASAEDVLAVLNS